MCWSWTLPATPTIWPGYSRPKRRDRSATGREGLNTKLGNAYAERENPTTVTGYWTGIGQRLGHWPALFAWMLIAAIVGSIIAMRLKRRRIAWKLVALTPAIFIPMLLIHGFAPFVPWWELDAGALIALAALWGYTERFRLLYTGKAPFGSQEAVRSAVSGSCGADRSLRWP